jgi:hypothetical protein
VAAVLIVGIGAILAFNASDDKAKGIREWLKATVDAGPAWSLSDSWATNVAGAGGILGSVITAAGSTSFGSLLTSDATTAITLLFLIFGGIAAFAPITYVAFATQPSSDTTVEKTNTSAWGFLAAAIVTMTAVMGELATVSLLVWQVGDSMGGKILLVVFVGIGAVLVAVYAIKTIILFAASQPAASQPAEEEKPRILPTQPLPSLFSNARSATL